MTQRQIIVEQSYGVHQHKPKKPVVLNENVKKIVREEQNSASQRQTRSSNPLPSVKQLKNLKYRNKKVRMIRLSDLRQYVDSNITCQKIAMSRMWSSSIQGSKMKPNSFAWSGRLDDFRTSEALKNARWMALTRLTGWDSVLYLFRFSPSLCFV
uniref:Uncharacterized protein n=1 Tax=Ditylenchus dipsaci TaxID=166011 RepID=A0A915D1S1_9BILA